MKNAETNKKKGFNRILEIMTEKGYAGRSGRLPSLSNTAYRKIGTNRYQFHEWMRNEKQPDIKQAAKLAALLGVEVTELYHKLKVAA